MTQGYNPNKPSLGAALESAPIKLNFNSIATDHAGATEPNFPTEGMTWLDTSNDDRIIKRYIHGNWSIIFSVGLDGVPSTDAGNL